MVLVLLLSPLLIGFCIFSFEAQPGPTFASCSIVLLSLLFPSPHFPYTFRLKLLDYGQLEGFVYSICLGVSMSIISGNSKTAIIKLGAPSSLPCFYYLHFSEVWHPGK